MRGINLKKENMKKLIKNLLILVSISLFVVSCEKTEDFTVLNADASTTLSLSTSDIILDKDNAGQEALSLTWTAPEFGFDAAVSYKVILTSGESTAEISVPFVQVMFQIDAS